jgi:ubiquitin-conjugating enzyme E2 variant
VRVEQEQGSSVAAIIDKVAVVGFGVCWSLLLFAFVVSAGPVAALGWLLALALPSVLTVDLAAGLVHWFADTFLTPRTPWVGPTVIQSFREHHLDPAALARRDAVEASGQNCLVCLPLLAGALWAGAVGPVSPGLLAGLIWFTFGIAATNRFHQWAHADAVPGWVATLQRGGWILSPEKHARHHAGAHDRAYCVTTGWLNPLLDAVRFFGRLEGSIRWLGSRRRARFARSLRSD